MRLGGFSVSSLILNQFSQHVLLQVGICWSLAKFHKTLFNNPFLALFYHHKLVSLFLNFGQGWMRVGVDNRQQKDNIKFMWIHVAMDNRW